MSQPHHYPRPPLCAVSIPSLAVARPLATAPPRDLSLITTCRRRRRPSPIPTANPDTSQPHTTAQHHAVTHPPSPAPTPTSTSLPTAAQRRGRVETRTTRHRYVVFLF